MNTRHNHRPRLLLGALALLAGAAPASARFDDATTSQTMSSSDGTTYQQAQVGTCVETYLDGTVRVASDCSNAQCSSATMLLDCEEDSTLDGCNHLLSCECDYQRTEYYQDVDYEDDTLLAGVLNAWQFDYGCDLGGKNAVGCAPVAAAMIGYWWAQQGYDGLVEDFMLSGGTGPADSEHDWKDLVRFLRDEYFDDGVCVPFEGAFPWYTPFSGQYAVAQEGLVEGLEDYFSDAGYGADIDHYRVCDSCAASADDDLTSDEGLAVVKRELRAGRPVIMGFNAGRAFDSYLPVLDAENLTIVNVYTGALSNGTPILGTIDHYAVITGYRELAGLDVITINAGWGIDASTGSSSADVAMQWNPAGKWLHLFTLDVNGSPDGGDWCAIDRGLGDSFANDGRLELSHAGQSVDETLAGSDCGIVRDRTVTYEAETYEPGFTCNTDTRYLHQLDNMLENGATGLEGRNPQGDDLIIDRQEPLP